MVSHTVGPVEQLDMADEYWKNILCHEYSSYKMAIPGKRLLQSEYVKYYLLTQLVRKRFKILKLKLFLIIF